MPKFADEPFHKTNINLYASDVEDLKRLYGFGWSEVVRKLVRLHLDRKKQGLPTLYVEPEEDADE